MQVSPSVLTCDYGHMADEFAFVERTGADMVHLDVMDGVFVPNLSFGPPVIARLRPLTRLPFDVHLMMEYPDRLLEAFAKAGADLINFHVESAAPVRETVDRIHALGCKAALTVKPKTPIEAVYPYLDALDMVLIMTVEPGFGGTELHGGAAGQGAGTEGGMCPPRPAGTGRGGRRCQRQDRAAVCGGRRGYCGGRQCAV